nr:3-deoxy-manno-octulosonate cytidylyltransferase [candidate division Zixibacteria bacterium]
MKSQIVAVIPARLGSRRFPGKPLAPIAGKPLIEHLYREASRARLIDRVVVATDTTLIAKAVQGFGGEAFMTSRSHRTGSDRTAEMAGKTGGEIFLNIQADVLGVKAAVYDRVLKAMLADKRMNFATLARAVESDECLYDPNRVKMIMDPDDYALWFSRYPLPFLQGVKGSRLKHFKYYYHIGVYFFRKTGLKRFTAWKQTPMEKAESLEQLRILENREKIKIFKIKNKLYSIDTPEDLKGVERYFS